MALNECARVPQLTSVDMPKPIRLRNIRSNCDTGSTYLMLRLQLRNNC